MRDSCWPHLPSESETESESDSESETEPQESPEEPEARNRTTRNIRCIAVWDLSRSGCRPDRPGFCMDCGCAAVGDRICTLTSAVQTNSFSFSFRKGEMTVCVALCFAVHADVFGWESIVLCVCVQTDTTKQSTVQKTDFLTYLEKEIVVDIKLQN